MSLLLEAPVPISGHVEVGFEPVLDAFVQNFSLRDERGATCVVYHQGKKVVDIWGGYRSWRHKEQWEEDSLVPIFSTSKGLASMAIAVACAKGWLDYDGAVSSYWPEFAANGKKNITVRQLLSHQAGLPALDCPISLEDIADEERLSHVLANQAPFWKVGERHGYHAVTLGWYEAALIRQVDPKGRTFRVFFQEEIAEPLGIEFYFGLPKAVPDERLVHIETIPIWQMLFHLNKLPFSFVWAFMNPWSLASKTIQNPKAFRDPTAINDRSFMELEVPAVTGIGQVRGIAKLYGLLANGGDGHVFPSCVCEELFCPAESPVCGDFDLVLRQETHYSLGFMKPFSAFSFSPSPRAFGSPGAGGSIGFADPDAKLGFAYAPSKMDFYLFDDPRADVLRRAVYNCLDSRFSMF